MDGVGGEDQVCAVLAGCFARSCSLVVPRCLGQLRAVLRMDVTLIATWVKFSNGKRS